MNVSTPTNRPRASWRWPLSISLLVVYIVVVSLSAGPSYAADATPYAASHLVARCPVDDPDCVPVPDPDPDPTPTPDPGDPECQGDLAARFTWEMPKRYGVDNNGNGLTDLPNNAAYAQPAGFTVRIQPRCAYIGGSPITYSLRIQGNGIDRTITHTPLDPSSTTFSVPNLQQGAYTATLKVTGQNGQTGATSQPVTVKDWLIVAIGDSFSSGEGNPDVRQTYECNAVGWCWTTEPAKWADGREDHRQCHRSKHAASARAAKAFEDASPHSSVTFIFLSCSGGTINTMSYPKPLEPDPAKYEGMGVLGPYRGAEPPDWVGYDVRNYLPSQIDQLAAIVGARRIDALTISAGGNDVHFPWIIEECAIWDNACPSDDTADLIEEDKRLLPGRYRDLAAALNDRSPAGRTPLNVSQVFMTEYPDLTLDDDGDVCDGIVDDIIVGRVFNRGELIWATREVALPLNEIVHGGVVAANDARRSDPANRPAWTYVDGIRQAFGNPWNPQGTGYGHGYCASEGMRWIRTATESAEMQGPDLHRPGTKGTMHPNALGHQAISQRLQYHMCGVIPGLPRPSSISSCAPVQPPGADAGVAEYRVYEGSSVQLDGTGGDPQGDPLTFAWTPAALLNNAALQDPTFIATADDAVHTLTLTVRDPNGQTGSDTTTVRVLNVRPQVTVGANATLNEGQSLSRQVTFTDPGADSWTTRVNYGDGAVENVAPVGKALTLSHTYADDGHYTVTVTVTDDDGGSHSASFIVTVNNVAPAVNAGPDVTMTTDDLFSASGSFTDPGADSWTATVDYGDGTGSQPLALTGKTFTLSHTYLNPGQYRVDVAVSDGDGGRGVDVAIVTVTPVQAPAVTLSPSSLNFGLRQVGTTSAAKIVTLTNSGTKGLAIDGISVAGTNAGDFTASDDCPATLEVDAQCVVGVTFRPSAAGSRAAALEIATDAAGSPHRITLSGIGGVNRLVNPGFEAATANGRPSRWTTAAGATDPRATRSAIQKHSGRFAMRHFATDNSGYFLGQTVTQVPAGTPVSFSGWVNIPRTSDRFSFKLRVVWLNGNKPIGVRTIKTFTAATRGWSQAQANLVAPPGATSARVEMVINNLNATIYVDDFVLLR